MSHGWPTSRLTSEDAVLSTLLELHGRRRLCRGQDGRFDGLIPSLDRKTKGQSRLERLGRERQCIEVFRAKTLGTSWTRVKNSRCTMILWP